MLERVVESSEERPYTVLAIVALISVGMLYGVTEITMSSEMERFLPEEYTSVKVMNRVENNVGGTMREVILVEGDGLTSASAFETLVELDNDLSEDPDLENYIEDVQSYPDFLIPVFENRVADWTMIPDSQLEQFIEMILSQPRFSEQIGSILTENRDATLVSVEINSQLSSETLIDRTEALDREVEKFDDEHENLSFALTGSVSMESETRGMMNRDNQILIPMAIVVIVVILFLVFRNLSDAVLPFLILGLGTVWMAGTMGLLGITFTMVYVALIPVILGVGIDYTIHMLNRYYEERGKDLPVGEASVRSVRTVGVAVALTALTTIIGFASFGTSDMPPIRNFGFLAASGVFYIFALATVLLPSLIVLRDRGGDEEGEELDEEERENDRLGETLSRLEMGVHRHRKPILAIVVVITAACVVSSFGLTTTMSFDTFLPQDSKSAQTMDRVETYFGGQAWQNYVLIEGDIKDPKNLETIQSLQNSVESDPRAENLISGSSSIAELVVSATGGNIPQSRAEVETVLNKLGEENPERVKTLLMGDERAIVYFTIKATNDKEMKKATDIIREHVEELSEQEDVDLDLKLDGEPAVGGAPAIISDILDSITPSMRNSIILAIILVAIVLSLVFRSPAMGLIGSLPVVLALFWEFGAMRILGWPLDIMNMMVSALAIGIGVDFAIHMTHRFREEWENNGKDPEKAISISIQSVGRAVLAAAATTVGAFLVLSLSRMPPVTRFGQLASLVIFFALVGAMVVLPSALLVYAKRKEANQTEE